MANMIDCGSNAATVLAQLMTPARNRYYYGKLLDAAHFDLEQDYGNRKRWLLNRLSLGAGVLCGLDVTIAQGPNGPLVYVSPGVAIDGVGREIIVPVTSPGINPLQPTDDCGQPSGTALTAPATVTLYLCYHECQAEPAPVMVSQCGPDQTCECGLIRERYRLQIRQGAFPNQPIPCGNFFSAPPDAGDPDRRRRLCGLLDPSCGTPADACVALAEIDIPATGAPTVDQCVCRTIVYSNSVLLDLILCLAERVDQCCGGKTAQLPVVTQVWPANAESIIQNKNTVEWDNFNKTPHVDITFSAAMNPSQLNAPDTWLAVYAVQLPGPAAGGNEATVYRFKLTQVPSSSLQPPPPTSGSTVTYRLDHDPIVPAYYLILIEATGGTMTDTQTPANTLAADYVGTGPALSAADIATCWALAPGSGGALPVADVTGGFVNSGAALPSGGDEVAGGVFTSWFQLARQA